MSNERKRIYLCLAHMSDEGLEQKYIKEAFDTNWVVPLGPNVNAFEEDLKQFIGKDKQGNIKEVVALSAGTAAVHLALIACGVRAGDEVCVQSFTFCASSNPIKYLGAKPILIDSESNTWNMDPDLLEKAIIERKQLTGKYPKAIIPVALYGMPYDATRIMNIAEKYGIPVIEDAAEGFGSKFAGQMLGTFGDYGVLSFNGNKMITTSGGGALICKQQSDKERIMWLATQAREGYPYYQHETIGYNYRLSNICAGIGRGQMTVAQEHIDHHKHIADLYRKAFAEIDGITYHDSPNDKYDSNFWLSTILIDPAVHVQGEDKAYHQQAEGAIGGAAGTVHQVKSLTTDCQPNNTVEAMRIFLDDRGIESRPLWKPMHKQPVYQNDVAYTNGVSESIFKQGLCLPSGPMVKDEDVTYIIDSIKQALL